MRWKRHSVQAILALRSLLLSGQWPLAAQTIGLS
jgi:hypothetical protein